MTTLWQDLRYAARGLSKSPGFTAIAVATLALGIGANTAIFSVVHAVLLRRLPYPAPDRLLVLRERQIHQERDMGVAWPNFLDWRAQARSFEGIAGFRTDHTILSGLGEPEMLRLAQVSAPFFPLLGARPVLGRSFDAADDRPGAPPVVLISQGLWKRRFGGDPSVLGRAVNLDAVAFTVVGVAPSSLAFFPDTVDVYTPVGLMGSLEEWQNRGNHSAMRVLARLAPGASIDSARREMEALMVRLEKEYPNSNSGQRATLAFLDDALFRDFRAALWILLAAVGVVLLIACANVAHLLLARAAARRREFAIRTAIGAGRGRLVRQLLTESLLLSAVGGAGGVVLAAWALGPLLRLAPPEIPRLADTHIDPAVLLFTLAASTLTGLVFGLVPAAQASRSDPQGTLRESGNSTTGGLERQRLRSALFVSEVALAFVLAVASGLLLRSLRRVEDVSPGLVTDGVLALDVYLPDAKYATRDAQRRFFEQALADLRRLPGVEGASASMCTPVVGQCWGSIYLVSDRPVPSQAELPSSAFNMVESDYFRTMRVPLKEGRYFDATDTPTSPPVVVINEKMARKWWPHASALGKKIKQGFPQDKSPYREIVGVVGDVPQNGLDEAIRTEVFLPMTQMQSDGMTLLVRTPGEPASLVKPAIAKIHALDKDLAVTAVQPMDQYIAESLARRRFHTLLLGAFGALALLLASVGIYGVVSYGVAQRRREIGIRTALGANPRDVLRLVFRQALRLAAIGLVLGAIAALGLTRFLASLLFGVGPTDPLTFGGVAILVTGIVALACARPARRAMAVDPATVLRAE
ncbi:MAG TPA: ABC transporter permease [Thermoanaerobaculia bacterium]|nr:ABC transporter permease [Thermoanaerobaculia bacterium]